jgi:periplasmic protein TonB
MDANTPIFATTPTQRPNRWLTGSLALHAALLTAFLIHRAPTLKAIDRPGSLTGHNVMLTYTPGTGAPAATLQAKQQPALPATPAPSLIATKTAPTPTTASTDPGTGNTTGDDALGDGNITLALELQHPSPTPDLSKLPSGTRGDVIVDVVIDEQGHIAKSTLQHGLGNGIDETVLATIQQWTFQPATRNGKPVPSEQELLFHYERG